MLSELAECFGNIVHIWGVTLIRFDEGLNGILDVSVCWAVVLIGIGQCKGCWILGLCVLCMRGGNDGFGILSSEVHDVLGLPFLFQVAFIRPS